MKASQFIFDTISRFHHVTLPKKTERWLKQNSNFHCAGSGLYLLFEEYTEVCDTYDKYWNDNHEQIDWHQKGLWGCSENIPEWKLLSFTQKLEIARQLYILYVGRIMCPEFFVIKNNEKIYEYSYEEENNIGLKQRDNNFYWKIFQKHKIEEKTFIQYELKDKLSVDFRRYRRENFIPVRTQVSQNYVYDGDKPNYKEATPAYWESINPCDFNFYEPIDIEQKYLESQDAKDFLIELAGSVLKASNYTIAKKYILSLEYIDTWIDLYYLSQLS